MAFVDRPVGALAVQVNVTVTSPDRPQNDDDTSPENMLAKHVVTVLHLALEAEVARLAAVAESLRIARELYEP